MTIVVATLLCYRKYWHAERWLKAVKALQTSDISFYFNVQIYDEEAFHFVNPIREITPNNHAIDVWEWGSEWYRRPEYDQDQSRLTPIVMARNMALNYARSMSASHILFVDSDVIIQPDGLNKLLEPGVPFIGGNVPGRGIHADFRYIFGAQGHETINGVRLLKCAHGTCGYMLIARSIFDYISFRWGPAYKKGTMLSEDPAYCNDVSVFLDIPFYIREDVTAEHLDDPEHPLTIEGVAKF